MLFQLLTEHNSKLSVTNEKGLLLSILYNLGKTINDDICNKNEIYNCIELITSNYCTNISVEELASYCNLSKSRFLHLFKKITQTSPVAFQQELRIDNAKLLLSSTQLSISDISFRCGYDDPLYFSRLFKKKTGISPKEYRKIYQNI